MVNGGNGNGNGNDKDEASLTFTSGEVVKTISQNQKEEATNITIDSLVHVKIMNYRR